MLYTGGFKSVAKTTDWALAADRRSVLLPFLRSRLYAVRFVIDPEHDIRCMVEAGFISDSDVNAQLTLKTNVSSRSAFDCHEAARRPKRSFRSVSNLVRRRT